MTTLQDDIYEEDGITIDDAKRICERELLYSWEILCGFTDVGDAYIPDIACKTEEDYNEHLSLYMDADVDAILKSNGEIVQSPWDDEQIEKLIGDGKYIKLKDKPKYMES